MKAVHLIEWDRMDSKFNKEFKDHFEYMDSASIGVTVEIEYTYKPYIPGVIDNIPEKCYPSEPEHVEIDIYTTNIPYAGFSLITRNESRDLHEAAYIAGKLKQSPEEFYQAVFDQVDAYINKGEELFNVLTKLGRAEYYDREGEDL